MSSRQNARKWIVDLPRDFMPPSAPRYMRLDDALRLANACLFTEWEGTRFGCLVTITWNKCGSTPDLLPRSAATLQEKVLDRVRRVFGDRDLPLRFVWWHECGSRMGEHLHIHMHLPQGLDAVARQVILDELDRVLKPNACGVDFSWHGKSQVAGYRTRWEIKRQVIYAIKNLCPSERARLPDGQMVNVREYIDLAGAAARVLRIPLGDPEPMPAGFKGKMTGASQNVGPQARAAAGWIELTSLPDLQAAIWLGYSPLNDAVQPPQPAKRKPRR